MNKTDVLIIGAGPTGLFCAHQLGIIGLSCEIVDNLDKAGGQCIELYPDKPIYDIPAVPECTGEDLTNNLLKQIKPFNVKFHLNERVEQLKKTESRWHVKTSGAIEFDVAAIVIAGGVGSFEPRKFPVKECEKFEGNSLLYSIKDKSIFKNKTISIFGGGDSALDWAIELSNTSDINLIHKFNLHGLKIENIFSQWCQKFMSSNEKNPVYDSLKCFFEYGPNHYIKLNPETRSRFLERALHNTTNTNNLEFNNILKPIDTDTQGIKNLYQQKIRGN